MDEPLATYDELMNMDDSTFVKLFKGKQVEQAKAVEDAKVESSVNIARDAELKAFDEDAKLQIAKLQSTLSEARTVIEKKYTEQLVALKQPIEVIETPVEVISKVI